MTEELRSIFGEFRVLSPDITTAMVFRLDGKVLASTENTTPERIQTLLENLKGLTHTECIGGIENFKIQDINTQMSVAAVSESYFAVVSQRGSDQKIVNSLTEIVAPTVIRLALGASAYTEMKPKLETELIEENNETEVLPAEAEKIFVPIVEPAEPPSPVLLKAPITQLMVEKIFGLLVSQYTVRIDYDVIRNWQEVYGNRYFTTVHIETLEGKTIVCTFKSIRNIKKGIIQIPERIIQQLESDNGKLVMVKPAVEEGERF